jgi:hypothetical protein
MSDNYAGSDTDSPKSPNIGGDLIDVLMRGLATAKERLEADDALARGQVCIGWYVDHDHSCALWYSNPQ